MRHTPGTKAAPVTFFGEDLGLGEGTRRSSQPNADAARASFLGSLVGVGTETFERFAGGEAAPLAIITFPGAGTATLQGDGLTVSQPTGTNGAGRYPISGNIYWETGSGLHDRIRGAGDPAHPGPGAGQPDSVQLVPGRPRRCRLEAAAGAAQPTSD